jgi:putative membrane protein
MTMSPVLFIPFLPLLPFFLIALLIHWAVDKARSRSGSSASPRGGSDLDIAKRRYAAGEISRDQFDQIRRDLAG